MQPLMHEMPGLAALEQMGLDAGQVLPAARSMDEQIKAVQRDGTLTDDAKTLRVHDVASRHLDSIKTNLETQIGKLSADIEGLQNDLYSNKALAKPLTPSQAAMLPMAAQTFDPSKPMGDNPVQNRMLLELESMGLLPDISRRLDALNSQETLTAIADKQQIMDSAIRITQEVQSYTEKNLPTRQAEAIRARMVD